MNYFNLSLYPTLPDPLSLQWLISQNSFHLLLEHLHLAAAFHFVEKSASVALLQWISFFRIAD